MSDKTKMTHTTGEEHYFVPCVLSFPFSPSLPPSPSISHFLDLPAGGVPENHAIEFIYNYQRQTPCKQTWAGQAGATLPMLNTDMGVSRSSAAHRHPAQRVRKGARRNPPETLQSQYESASSPHRQQWQQTRASPGIRPELEALRAPVFYIVGDSTYFIENPPLRCVFNGTFRIQGLSEPCRARTCSESIISGPFHKAFFSKCQRFLRRKGEVAFHAWTCSDSIISFPQCIFLKCKIRFPTQIHMVVK